LSLSAALISVIPYQLSINFTFHT